MIWKITILLWIAFLIAVRIVRGTMSREEKIRAMMLGKVRITPFRVLTCLLFFCIFDYDVSNSNLVPVLLFEISIKIASR